MFFNLSQFRSMVLCLIYSTVNPLRSKINDIIVEKRDLNKLSFKTIKYWLRNNYTILTDNILRNLGYMSQAQTESDHNPTLP